MANAYICDKSICPSPASLCTGNGWRGMGTVRYQFRGAVGRVQHAAAEALDLRAQPRRRLDRTRGRVELDAAQRERVEGAVAALHDDYLGHWACGFDDEQWRRMQQPAGAGKRKPFFDNEWQRLREIQFASCSECAFRLPRAGKSSAPFFVPLRLVTGHQTLHSAPQTLRVQLLAIPTWHRTLLRIVSMRMSSFTALAEQNASVCLCACRLRLARTDHSGD